MYTAVMAFGESAYIFFKFPANLLNNPNLDSSESIFLTPSFRDVRGTAAREKQIKLLKS